jgi:hypothetical protein
MPNVRDASRRIERLLDEVARMQSQLEQYSRTEASALRNLSSSQQRLASATPSFRASNQRDVDRYNKEVLEVQRKKAELQAMLARKNAELPRLQRPVLRGTAEPPSR